MSEYDDHMYTSAGEEDFECWCGEVHRTASKQSEMEASMSEDETCCGTE